GGQAQTYNILPMISFKTFMADQRDDGTPEEFKQRYENYKADYIQRLSQSFYSVHSTEEWFQERYHPVIAHNKREEKQEWALKEVVTFGDQLKSNPAGFIASASLEPAPEVDRWTSTGGDWKNKWTRKGSTDYTTKSEEGDTDMHTADGVDKDTQDEADHNTVDAKAFMEHTDKVVFVRRVPAWVRVEDLAHQVEEETGPFERILTSDATKAHNDDFARSAYIIYPTSEAAHSAHQRLNKLRVFAKSHQSGSNGKQGHGDGGKFFELKTFSFRPRGHGSVDSEFSEAHRVVHDTQQSIALAKAIDTEQGLTSKELGITFLLQREEVEEALAASPLSTAKLDLVCAYLKRVHFFVYYKGQQCQDEGDIIGVRTACRAKPAASKEDVEKAMESADTTTLLDSDGKEGKNQAETTGGRDVRERRKGRDPGAEEIDVMVTQRIKEAEAEPSRTLAAEVTMKRFNNRVKSVVDDWLKKHTERTEEGYARCNMPNCAKLFKAAEFVHKHLVNKHPDLYKAVVDEVTEPFVRDLFLEDEAKPLPSITADNANQPVGMSPGGAMMGGPMVPMGGVFPIMGGMPMGPMGSMGPPMGMIEAPPIGPMGGPMQQSPLAPPPDGMMNWGGAGGRGFGGRGGQGIRGRGGGRFMGRGMGMMGRGGGGMAKPMPPAQPIGPSDPRSIVSYVDVDAPTETTPDLDYGDAFPALPKKKKQRKEV
ncbi:unnamed protein product, partial [Choristocarpus tenellus]